MTNRWPTTTEIAPLGRRYVGTSFDVGDLNVGDYVIVDNIKYIITRVWYKRGNCNATLVSAPMRVCSWCKYYEYGCVDDEFKCINAESMFFADHVKKADVCEKFTEDTDRNHASSGFLLS